MTQQDDITQLETILERLFQSKLNDLVQQLEMDDSMYQVDIPDHNTIDVPVEEILSIVARTSNNYVRLARYAGIAKAQYKIAKARYDRTYKQNYIGTNKESREKNAMEAAAAAQQALGTWESVSDLIQGIEQGAKVASESSRKILGHMTEVAKGQMREAAGVMSAKDFTYNQP